MDEILGESCGFEELPCLHAELRLHRSACPSLDFISPALRNVTLFGNAAYSQGWDGQNDQPLASIDPFKAVAGLRYAWADFQLEFMTTYTARQSLTSGVATPNQFVPDSFVMLDLVARWQVTEKITFTAGLYNLTNEKA